MPDVVIVRPGCTDFDEQHRIQGSLDLPLNQRGQEQVQYLVNELRGTSLEVIYTSDCDPARSTAEAIGQALGIPVKEVEGLRNWNQGLWQGLQFDDLKRKFPKVFKQWRESPETICPPQGETVGDALQRVAKALNKPLKRKTAIAVVVCEPLASLISCMIQGRKAELPYWGREDEQPPLIECLNTEHKGQENARNGQTGDESPVLQPVKS